MLPVRGAEVLSRLLSNMPKPTPEEVTWLAVTYYDRGVLNRGAAAGAPVPRKTGWSPCRVFKKQRMPGDTLGYGGAISFIKLSDGRVICTNDLWMGNSEWCSSVPQGAMTGYKLPTWCCKIRTREALDLLLSVLKPWGSLWKVRVLVSL